MGCDSPRFGVLRSISTSLPVQTSHKIGARDRAKNEKSPSSSSLAIRDEEDSAVPPWLVASSGTIGGPEGARTLGLHNAIVALSQLSYGPLFTGGHATHSFARNGRLRRGLLASTARLPDEFGPGAHRGRAAGFPLAPAHCGDDLLLPITAVSMLS